MQPRAWIAVLLFCAAGLCRGAPGGLREAVRSGDLAAIKNLIDAGADLNERDSLGATPLLDAAWYGNEQIVRMLVEGGARVDAAHEEGGSTPLDYAVLRGNATIARLLIDRGAKSSRALHTAALHGQAEIAQLLIAAGSPCDARDDNGSSPLDLAAMEGNRETVEALLAGGAKVDAPHPATGATPLLEAAGKGNAAAVTVLLRVGADPRRKDREGRTPLENAAEAGRVEVVGSILDHVGDTPSHLSALLRSAAGRGDARLVSLLAARGADLADGAPLNIAARKGFVAVAEALFEFQVSPNRPDSTGATPIYDAAVGGHAAMVSMLIRHGASANVRDGESGDTALYAASSLGHAEVVRILLAHGADPNLPNKAGHRPLYAASSNGYSELATEIHRRGGN